MLHINEQPPSEIERAEDERYANDFNTIVAWFRIDLESSDPLKVMQRLAVIMSGRWVMSHEQPLIYFRDQWGLPSVLRALAKAIESPEHVLGELQGD